MIAKIVANELKFAFKNFFPKSLKNCQTFEICTLAFKKFLLFILFVMKPKINQVSPKPTKT